MFDAIPYRLTVRRVRSGDCDKIGELYEIVAPGLFAFCLSLTNDAAAARRSAEGAFVHASGLLVRHSLTVANFRSALLGEAKGRCYEELGRAAMAEFSEMRVKTPEPFDLAQLQEQLEEMRPEALSTPAARLTWRSRMAPSTAITVVLVMVVMIEMAALGLDLIPQSPRHGNSGSTPAAIAKQVDNPPLSKAVSAQDSSNKTAEKSRIDDSASEKSSSSERRGDSNSTSEQPASDSSKREPGSSPAGDKGFEEVPVANDLPELPLPEVKVDVEAGPVDVQVDLPNGSAVIPSASACVDSNCVTLP